MRIPGLKAYDVKVFYRQPITINYRVPFSEVIKEDSFKHLGSDDKYKIYQGKNTNARFFIMTENTQLNFIVNSIDPAQIRSAHNLYQPAFSKEVFSKHVTNSFSKLIFS